MLLGSLDIVGNPISLLMSIHRGFLSLFSVPQRELHRRRLASASGNGITDIISAVNKGLYSFSSHIARGGLISVYSVSSALSRNLYAFEQKQPERQRGVLGGIKQLGTGLRDGLTGTVMKPIDGAKRQGAWGLVKGLGSGVVGIVAKPLSGVLGLVAETSYSLSNSLQTQDELEQTVVNRYELPNRLLTSGLNVLSGSTPTHGWALHLSLAYLQELCRSRRGGRLLAVTMMTFCSSTNEHSVMTEASLRPAMSVGLTVGAPVLLVCSEDVLLALVEDNSLAPSLLFDRIGHSACAQLDIWHEHKTDTRVQVKLQFDTEEERRLTYCFSADPDCQALDAFIGAFTQLKRKHHKSTDQLIRT
jgi:hypothetical protein